MERYNEMDALYFDRPAKAKIAKELNKYLLDEVYYVQVPSPRIFTFWSPWVKGYHGEYMVGYGNFGDFPIYIWIGRLFFSENFKCHSS